MEFAASLDSSAETITTVVCILFVGIAVWNGVGIKRAKGDMMNMAVRIGIFAVLLVTLGYSFMYSVTGYAVRGKALIIKMRHAEIPYTYTQIMDVRAVGAGEMASLKKSFGIGGLFGYSGQYHADAFGDITFYGTQQKNWVLMHTDKNEAIVLTPDDPAKLVKEVMAIITPNN